jgi:hypothetical protein
MASGEMDRPEFTAFLRGALIEEVRFAVDSPLEGTGFEPSVPRVGNCAHETAPFDRRGIFRPFSTSTAPDLE